MFKYILLVCLIAVVLLGGYFGLAFILHNLNKNAPNQVDTKSKQEVLDQNLVGSWDTGCLVPDPSSPWAERHTMTIIANGTGVHKRSSGAACGTLTEDNVDNFHFTIPGQEKIDLSYTSGVASGNTVYDIYQITGKSLKFGHGFCNCTSESGKFGLSENDRFTKLNDFLVYKKH